MTVPWESPRRLGILVLSPIPGSHLPVSSRLPINCYLLPNIISPGKARDMFRTFLGCVVLALPLAPVAFAQGVTVCIFPAKEARGVNTAAPSDVTALAKELVLRTLPGGATLSVVPAADVAPKDIDAEAEHRNCTHVVTVWRMETMPDTPNYAGTLGGTQASNGQNNALMLKDTKLPNGVLVEYSLRKADSHKPLAHGESDNGSAYASFATAIVRKLGQGK